MTGLAARLKEAAALGFSAALVPAGNLGDDVNDTLDVRGAATVDDALRALLP